ncbi:MAG: hypothetical protein GXP45_03150 [bacterium]|nr:hypothetical protein [bacterium]
MLLGVSFATVELQTLNLDEVINMADQEIQNINNTDNTDTELEEAIQLLHQDAITKYDTIDTFMPEHNIRRDEAAKMFVNFQKNTLGEKDFIPQKNCKFTDLHQGHSDLIDLMQESC